MSEFSAIIDGVTEPTPRVPSDDLRVSDAERAQVQDLLRRAHDVGQLDLTEFDERVRTVWASRTRGELARITADLPAPPPAAVVGVLGIGAAATTYAVQEQRLDDQRTAVAQAQQQADRIQAVLAAPDAALHASDLNGGGRVTVVVSDTQDAGVVVLADAPAPGPDRAYQLWLVPTGSTTPVSAGLLPAGQAQATELIQGVRGRAEFAVSLEPAGGSPAPSTTPLVGISLV